MQPADFLCRRDFLCKAPYGITPEGLRNLQRLAEQGWDITIDAGCALHFPGWTVAIWIEGSEAAR